MSSARGAEGSNGTLAGGRYRVVGQLGRGGMGTVYRAVDELLGREVAVKELRTFADVPGPERTALWERTRREARAAARIRHAGVVAVHDVVEAEGDGRPVIVMELVDGPSLDEVLRERGALEPGEAAAIGAKVAEALGAAHDAGVLHRDVKPGNILLERGGRVVLTDFGIATVEEPDGAPPSHLTQNGPLVGSLEFLAPERARGTRPGPASDVWSLGATLFAVVEGTSPFRRDSTWSTVNAIVTDPLPEPRRAGPLAPVLRELLAKDPRTRPDARRAARMLAAVARETPGGWGGVTGAIPAPPAAGPVPGQRTTAPAAPAQPSPPRPQPGWTPPRAFAGSGVEGPTRPQPGWRPPVGPGVTSTLDLASAASDPEPWGGRRGLAIAAVVAAVVLVGAGVAWTVVGRSGPSRTPAHIVAEPDATVVRIPAVPPTDSGSPGKRPDAGRSRAKADGAPAATASPGATHGSGRTAPVTAPRPKPKPTPKPTTEPAPWASCTYYSGTALTEKGDTGNAVKEVQCILVARGFSVGSGGVDGQFGPDTQAGVEAFQTARHITVDGQVGPQTWAALRG